MAQELDDGKFWLPSEFLTDDELLMDFKTECFELKGFNDFSDGYVNSFGINSDLSSPVESVVGSGDTESDEDDYITGLTLKLAHSTLEDSSFACENAKGWKLSGSPQSTLCSVVPACGCVPGSGRGSSNRVSRVSSPLNVKDVAAWDLLYAAAEEVARMRLMEETTASFTGKPFGPPRRPSPITVPLKNSNQGSGFYPNQSYLYQQLQAAQFQLLKQLQMMKQQQQGSGPWGDGKMGYQPMVQNVRRNGGPGNQGLSTVAWPTVSQPQQQQQQQQQAQPSSGMRAVYLGESESKRERTGTGVFLPRTFGTNSVETRKKTAGCSTVLLPDRVVHALNLNLESINAHPPEVRNKASDFLDADAALKHRNIFLMAQQRRNLRTLPVMNQELSRLPQEWTY